MFGSAVFLSILKSKEMFEGLAGDAIFFLWLSHLNRFE